MTPEDRIQLAAEYALGVLEGGELDEARAAFAADPEFREEVARWFAWLAPLLDEIAAETPPPHLLARIEERIAQLHDRGGNVVQLRRKVNLWRGMAAGASALAASLALVLVTQRPVVERVPVERPAVQPMVVSMAGEQGEARLVATWNADRRRMMIAAAEGMTLEQGRAHELWVIPGDGTPRSLGLVPAAAPAAIQIPANVAGLVAAGATLAVSVEPAGGSPTGLPTGPVIATGTMLRT